MIERNKLYVSFSGLVKLMKEDKVRPQDFSDGDLFYFGCIRDHVFEPIQMNDDIMRIFSIGHPMRSSGDEVLVRAKATQAYQAIQQAVSSAEARGRAIFRKMNEPPSFNQLNQLLAQNSIDTSSVAHLIQDEEAYNCWAVERHYSHLVEVVVGR